MLVQQLNEERPFPASCGTGDAFGYDFLDKIDSAVCDIGAHPNRWPVVLYNIRRRLIHRFPYALLYRIDTDEVVILATMHLHKRPGYWTSRL